MATNGSLNLSSVLFGGIAPNGVRHDTHGTLKSTQEAVPRLLEGAHLLGIFVICILLFSALLVRIDWLYNFAVRNANEAGIVLFGLCGASLHYVSDEWVLQHATECMEACTHLFLPWFVISLLLAVRTGSQVFTVGKLRYALPTNAVASLAHAALLAALLTQVTTLPGVSALMLSLCLLMAGCVVQGTAEYDSTMSHHGYMNLQARWCIALSLAVYSALSAIIASHRTREQSLIMHLSAAAVVWLLTVVLSVVSLKNGSFSGDIARDALCAAGTLLYCSGSLVSTVGGSGLVLLYAIVMLYPTVVRQHFAEEEFDRHRQWCLTLSSALVAFAAGLQFSQAWPKVAENAFEFASMLVSLNSALLIFRLVIIFPHLTHSLAKSDKSGFAQAFALGSLPTGGHVIGMLLFLNIASDRDDRNGSLNILIDHMSAFILPLSILNIFLRLLLQPTLFKILELPQVQIDTKSQIDGIIMDIITRKRQLLPPTSWHAAESLIYFRNVCVQPPLLMSDGGITEESAAPYRSTFTVASNDNPVICASPRITVRSLGSQELATLQAIEQHIFRKSVVTLRHEGFVLPKPYSLLLSLLRETTPSRSLFRIAIPVPPQVIARHSSRLANYCMKLRASLIKCLLPLQRDEPYHTFLRRVMLRVHRRLYSWKERRLPQVADLITSCALLSFFVIRAAAIYTNRNERYVEVVSNICRAIFAADVLLRLAIWQQEICHQVYDMIDIVACLLTYVLDAVCLANNCSNRHLVTYFSFAFHCVRFCRLVRLAPVILPLLLGIIGKSIATELHQRHNLNVCYSYALRRTEQILSTNVFEAFASEMPRNIQQIRHYQFEITKRNELFGLHYAGIDVHMRTQHAITVFFSKVRLLINNMLKSRYVQPADSDLIKQQLKQHERELRNATRNAAFYSQKVLPADNARATLHFLFPDCRLFHSVSRSKQTEESGHIRTRTYKAFQRILKRGTLVPGFVFVTNGVAVSTKLQGRYSGQLDSDQVLEYFNRGTFVCLSSLLKQLTLASDGNVDPEDLSRTMPNDVCSVTTCEVSFISRELVLGWLMENPSRVLDLWKHHIIGSTLPQLLESVHDTSHSGNVCVLNSPQDNLPDFKSLISSPILVEGGLCSRLSQKVYVAPCILPENEIWEIFSKPKPTSPIVVYYVQAEEQQSRLTVSSCDNVVETAL